MVDSGVIEDKSTTVADELDKPPVEQVETDPVAAKRRGWSLPTVTLTRERTDELAQAVTNAGARVVTLLRRVVTVCWSVVSFGATVVWRLIRQVPPVLQLLGALGLCALLSIAGSVALDNGLGRTCAVVFVPGFALAFGVVAHHWYLRVGAGEKPQQEVAAAPAEPTLDLQRSVEYVDSKLAFALNALGTDRQQQAVIALIQAKTATELSFGSGQEPIRQNLRPRIRAGASMKTPARESISVVGRT